MKKIIKVAAVVLAAGMIFAGCKNEPKDPTNPTAETLFDETKVTETAEKVELSDGNWAFQAELSEELYSMKIFFSFTAKDGAISEANKLVINSTSILDENDENYEEELASSKKMGAKINGNKVSYYKEFNKADIAKIATKTRQDFAKEDNSEDFICAMNYNNAKTSIESLIKGKKGNEKLLKTNAKKTQYYYSETYDVDGNYQNYKIYLSKK